MATTYDTVTERRTASSNDKQQLVAAPPKLRRRPTLIAAAVAAICLGALVSVWAWNSASTAQSVVAVRQTVERGQVIERSDLMSVQISVDPALKPLPATKIDELVGKRAALDIPAGGVVTAEQVTSSAVPAKGQSVVGVSLTPSMLPVGQVRVGDHVRVVTTAVKDEKASALPDAIDAVVVNVSRDEATGNTLVNVQVPHEQAPKVASQAASGDVALVLDSQEG